MVISYLADLSRHILNTPGKGVSLAHNVTSLANKLSYGPGVV